MTPVLLAAESEALALHVHPLVGIAVAVVLLAANAFFVAAEIALLAARRTRIEELADQGDPRAKIAAAALRELSVTFSGAQLGITMASLGLGAIAEPAVADLFESWLGATALPGGTRAAIAFAVALLIVVFLHMVVGEMLPKNVALADAERVSLRLARAFRGYVVVFRPLIVALNATANALVRLVGVEPRDELGLVHTASELSLVVRESRREGALPPQEARVLGAALRLSEIDAEAAMTPRVDLAALPDDARATDVLDLARETGYTRFPVYHQEIDDIVGVVHVKDVLIRDAEDLEGVPVGDVIRPIPAVPETRDLERLLRDMRRDRSHAVLVVDEFGGTAGIVTLEDVLEELVGEIEDEFDPHVHEVRKLGDRRWVVPGTLRRDELEQHTGLELEAGDSETVSGFLTEHLGRLVQPGDQVETDGWRLRVRSLDGRRAGDVEVVAPAGAVGSPDDGAPPDRH
ncbi:MAG: hemolysin family protein [Actinobacteria bacterium]|nr:hemolysin family protein [Actinomycetota bacterium]